MTMKYDEEELNRAIEKGTAAWADVPDISEWVSEQRGRIPMTQFGRAIEQDKIICDICGAVMWTMHGGGMDNDRIVCSNIRSCGAEIVFPTSTELPVDIP